MTAELKAVQKHIAALRALPAAVGLDAKEALHRQAVEALADWETRINAPGLSPSQRAALRNDIGFRNARDVAASRTRDLDAAYHSLGMSSAIRAAVGANHSSSPEYCRLMGQRLGEYARANPGTGTRPVITDALSDRLYLLRAMGTPEALAEAQMLLRGILSPTAPSFVLANQQGALALLAQQNTAVAGWITNEIRANRLRVVFVEELWSDAKRISEQYFEGAQVISGVYDGNGVMRVARFANGRVRDQWDVVSTIAHEARHYLENARNTHWQEVRCVQWSYDVFDLTAQIARERMGTPLTPSQILTRVQTNSLYANNPLGTPGAATVPTP